MNKMVGFMVMRRRRRTCTLLSSLVLLLSLCGSSASLHIDFRSPRRANSYDDDHQQLITSRRELMSRLGSYPPRCMAKCGTCIPCYPVHVAVPPGNPVTTEYYPEAWRCKCSNKLYMP